MSTKRLLIVFAVLALGATACADAFRAGAAVVNGQRISVADLEARILATGAGAEPAADPALQRQALQQLIEESLLREEARRRGLGISDEEVERQYMQISAQFPSEEEFREALRVRGFTEESLRNAIRDQVMREELAEALAGEVDDEEVRQVYEIEIDRFTQARARHILLRVADPTADDQVRERALRIAQRIRDGEPFQRLARNLSEDEGTAGQGGDLGFISLGDLVPEFAQAARDAEIGEIVGPVRTQFGYHIIEVLERQVIPFDEARDQVRQQLELQLGERALGEFLDEALTRARVRVNPRYGDWDPETQSIVPHRSFVPASPQPDPNEPPPGLFGPGG